MATEDDYKIGLDTEKWFEETVKREGGAVELKHKSTDFYDFIGRFGDKLFLLDVKFLQQEYRLKGFFEISAWGKETGIFAVAKKAENVKVLSAILHCGEYYIIDVKALRAAVERGEVRKYDRVNAKGCPITFVVMDGFDDPRFCLIKGKMSTEAWNDLDKTSSLKTMDIDAWMKGQFQEVA
jgi:hypothetical protein